MTAFAYSQTRSGSLFAALAGLYRAWREDARKRAAYVQTRDELSDLTDRELDDLGLTRWDIESAARKSVYGL